MRITGKYGEGLNGDYLIDFDLLDKVKRFLEGIVKEFSVTIKDQVREKKIKYICRSVKATRDRKLTLDYSPIEYCEDNNPRHYFNMVYVEGMKSLGFNIPLFYYEGVVFRSVTFSGNHEMKIELIVESGEPRMIIESLFGCIKRERDIRDVIRCDDFVEREEHKNLSKPIYFSFA